MATCLNCGSSQFKDGVCLQCGVGPKIGPAVEPEIDMNYVCPSCGAEFDGWDCLAPECGSKLPPKARKAIGRRLSRQEAAEARKSLGIK